MKAHKVIKGRYWESKKKNNRKWLTFMWFSFFGNVFLLIAEHMIFNICYRTCWLVWMDSANKTRFIDSWKKKNHEIFLFLVLLFENTVCENIMISFSRFEIFKRTEMCVFDAILKLLVTAYFYLDDNRFWAGRCILGFSPSGRCVLDSSLNNLLQLDPKQVFG